MTANPSMFLGTKDFTLLGRTGRLSCNVDFLSLANADSLTTIIRADVSCFGEIANAIRVARTRSHCTKGVVHAAGLQVCDIHGHPYIQHRHKLRMPWNVMRNYSPSTICIIDLWRIWLIIQVAGKLVKQTIYSMRAVIAPKLSAMEHLGRVIHGAPMGSFTLFSSISSIAGFSGHANYCAANATLDVHAQQDALRGLPTAAIQWGAWSVVGMACPTTTYLACLLIPLFEDE